MALKFNQEAYIITDQSGNIKFSTDRKMPTFVEEIVGFYDVRNVIEGGDTSNIINRKDEFVITTNPIINKNDYIVFPFFKIYGGVSDTAGTIITGGGSIVLRVLRQPSTGLYLGSSLLSVEVEEDQLKFVINHALDRTGFKNITGDDIIKLAYRIYYGRFT